ncbi:hypothetical protein, partial [Shimia sp.]|uniref:hypothetical protein n=1 Tax=Shimia sp. TaxID=1954381 RepID=UPI0025EF31BC
LPWDLGKKGSRRAICASVNQKRSDMFTARFQTVKHAIRRKSMGPDPMSPDPISVKGHSKKIEETIGIEMVGTEGIEPSNPR